MFFQQYPDPNCEHFFNFRILGVDKHKKIAYNNSAISWIAIIERKPLVVNLPYAGSFEPKGFFETYKK